MAAYRTLTLSADAQGDGACLEARIAAWFFMVPCHIYISAGEGLLLELATVTRQEWNPQSLFVPLCDLSVPLSKWCWFGLCSGQPPGEAAAAVSDDSSSGLCIVHLDAHVCCRPPSSTAHSPTATLTHLLHTLTSFMH